MGRILVGWNGARFGLDIERMRAAAPGAPARFWLSDPALVAAIWVSVSDGEFHPESATIGRGALSTAYAAWAASLEQAMRDSTPDAASPESWVTIALFLNERVYKGQLADGLARVRAAHAATSGPALDAALRHYFATLGRSQWVEDLDRLNGGALRPLLP